MCGWLYDCYSSLGVVVGCGWCGLLVVGVLDCCVSVIVAVSVCADCLIVLVVVISFIEAFS